MTARARSSHLLRSLVCLGAAAATSVMAVGVAMQPDLVLPDDVRTWGTLALAAMAAGFALLGCAGLVRRRTS